MATFCLVHGAWHDASCWELLTGELERRGHDCIAPVLPVETVGATFEDYAQVVIDRLVGHDEPVVVGHSMSSAVVPLVAVARPVALLVYLCPAMRGFPAPEGEPPSRRAGYEPPPTDERDVSRWPIDRAVSDFYAHVDPALARQYAARLRPQWTGVFSAPYPLARPPQVPSAFIYAREDEVFDDRWSRWISQTMFGIEPIELPGGHFPMLEDPALLADHLDRLAVREGAG
jgi:pimeloyl-ACP methyl ester carboxylesterase